MTTKELSYKAPVSKAVALGATSPDPGQPGCVIWSTTTGTPLYWDGSSWQSLYPIVSIGFYFPETSSSSKTVYRAKLQQAFSIAANLSGSVGSASANAAGTTTFTIKKNGSSIGTATWTAGNTVPSLATASGATQSFAVGDLLEVIYAGDTTLADPSLTLVMTRA